MSVFDRLSNVAKGKLSNAVGDLERSNPEAVYEAAIDNAVTRIGEHKQAVAGLAHQRQRLEDKRSALEDEARQVEVALGAALSEDDDETALVLTARRDELVVTIEDLAREHATVAAAVAETTESLRTLRGEVESLKRERESALAQLAAAEASIEVADAASGFSDSAQAKGLESVRSAIRVLEAQAHEGYLDEEGNSIRGRAAALGKKAAEADARAQLEAMKRALRGESEGGESEGEDEEGEAPPAAPSEKKRNL